ncbi:hypothetical protein CH272_28090 [Rhodococcus sp. 05-340-1]|uniref:3-phenylpropionate/cinnamic acid dioxygenase subunit beta n=1 Tax=unclassified Rhodococcus (in: high G+C Gram-positive bacteria) TaxID=192944 RepID=UPI000B9B762C|nr:MULTISPECIES: 3-phenylpropionate/cinnamic acid dioxygenase subunit beta [unclassified Rhodococcus (in: high G+C Gram-positive bacteria)]OZD68872.1 hypothetical protein CH271_10810 [Rhodococcus sp. 05-340-2]OZD69345.1 hypothetical protein CH272_28090 [Rhodococcus sp. 05-340-1]
MSISSTRPRSARRLTTEVHRELEEFLYEEAETLDNWEFREWLSLMAKDVHYWAPVRENRTYRERLKEQAEKGGSAYFDENWEHLSQRVDRLYTHMAWAEEPPSRTRHLITNIRARSTDTVDEFTVSSSFYVHRTRTERDHDWIVGKRLDVIRRVDTDLGFEIAERTVIFDVATLLNKNLSLFY